MNTAESQPATPKAKRRWYQYRLRTLLAFVVACAFGCGCLALPTARAYRFVSAVKRGELERVDSMFGKSRDGFPGTATQARLSELEVAPLTFEQLWRGERFVRGYVPYGPEMYVLDCHVVLRVTMWDIKIEFYMHG
jgi:hypothetical protein